MKAEIVDDARWRVEVPESEVADFIAMTPGTRKYISRAADGSKVYTMPATYTTTNALIRMGCKFRKPGAKAHFLALHQVAEGKFPWKQRNKHPVPEPMKHQHEAVDKFWPMRSGGVFHDKGTGKTFTYITMACAWYPHDVDQILVVCPNSVVENWPDEIEKYAWVPTEVLQYSGPSSRPRILRELERKPKGLRWLIMSVESLSAGNGPKFIEAYVKRARTAMVVDESQYIKNWKAGRTKVCIDVGGHCVRRHAMTGNPVTQKIEELYAVGLYLDPRIHGYTNYYAFRNRYCVMGGFKQKQVVRYDNVEELLTNFGPFCHVVEKREALPDLPPKVYESRWYHLTPQQQRMMESIKEARILGEHEIKNVLEAFLRMQQVCSGVLPEGMSEPINPIPKLVMLTDLVTNEFETGQLLVWCKWRDEIAGVMSALAKAGEKSLVELHGGIPRPERQELLKQFEDGKFRVAVATPSSMGIGVDKLKTAETTIFYSNTFSWDERSQAEDRTHRKGTKGDKRIYIDLLCRGSVDEYVYKALNKRMDVADAIRQQLDIAGKVLI